jgi:hypothetical protein
MGRKNTGRTEEERTGKKDKKQGVAGRRKEKEQRGREKTEMKGKGPQEELQTETEKRKNQRNQKKNKRKERREVQSMLLLSSCFQVNASNFADNAQTLCT